MKDQRITATANELLVIYYWLILTLTSRELCRNHIYNIYMIMHIFCTLKRTVSWGSTCPLLPPLTQLSVPEPDNHSNWWLGGAPRLSPKSLINMTYSVYVCIIYVHPQLHYRMITCLFSNKWSGPDSQTVSEWVSGPDWPVFALQKV